MHHINTIDALRDRFLTHREAYVAAAILPRLPGGECLVRLHDRDTYEEPEETRRFAGTATIAGTQLHRVKIEDGKKDAFHLTPAPHSIRAYKVSGHDFDAFVAGTAPDFDTDQTSLSDFGGDASIIQQADPIGDKGEPGGQYDRKPVSPL